MIFLAPATIPRGGGRLNEAVLIFKCDIAEHGRSWAQQRDFEDDYDVRE
jgi:hypothetical protein